MQATELQVAFFKHIKDKLADHLSLVDEIADLLNISNDSAYRRLRGEKTLGFDEIQLLANHYKVSLDQFLKLQTNTFSFFGDLISRERFGIDSYIKGIAKQLEYWAGASQKEIFFFNKDIPTFHHFMFPELAAFKCYFWSRYNLNCPDYNKGQFLISDFIELFNSTGKKISEYYLEIPSTEIWNLDCINTTIRQIDYYRESKVFQSQQDIVTVFDCLDKLVNHIEQQAEYGAKFPFGKPDILRRVKYSVFINQFILGDNTVFVKADNERMVSLNHNVINYTITNDEQFVEYSWQTLDILLKKSTLISEIGERDRQLFFETLRQRIHEKRKLV